MTLRKSRLPLGGSNLFQEIKEQCRKAEQDGKKIINLSIGQPSGPALFSARNAASWAVMSDREPMHGYQDNTSPGVPDFARRFVAAHIKYPIPPESAAYLPIPGIKPILGMIPQACGAITNPKSVVVATMTDPGYPTPATQCRYLGVPYYPLPLNQKNEFRFGVDDIRPETNLLMLNLPHNPSGQIADKGWWDQICGYCAKNNVRLFNDAAYAALSHTPESSMLAEIAVGYPTLSWAEAFSASKLINFTGWRVGAIVGSPDFVGDIGIIKGNTDSGFVAPMAAGVIFAVENDQAGIGANRRLYGKRITILKESLEDCGMRLAVEPKAGFFTLWEAPKQAFGCRIASGRDFNDTMIEKAGIAGVPFGTYIRYSVTSSGIESMASDIAEAFKAAKIRYD